MDGVPARGRRLFDLVAEMELEGNAAKRFAAGGHRVGKHTGTRDLSMAREIRH
jgi:hypothetical protein